MNESLLLALSCIALGALITFWTKEPLAALPFLLTGIIWLAVLYEKSRREREALRYAREARLARRAREAEERGELAA